MGTKYIIRCYIRDNECLITGLQTESRLEIAHIIPRRYYTDVSNLSLLQPLINCEHYHHQWARKGYPSKITDTEHEIFLGVCNIDTVQNVITLRADLSLTWETFDFCVDPNVSYTEDPAALTLDLTIVVCLEKLPRHFIC